MRKKRIFLLSYLSPQAYNNALNIRTANSYRFTPMARSTLGRLKIPQLFAAGKECIKNILAKQRSVSITTDIWSDRTMRSFLGVTAHAIISNPTSGSVELKSMLLSCQRFSGSHTGERIASAFEEVIEVAGIKNKIDFVLTDNASNMKAAFKTKFPSAEDENVVTGTTEDSEDEENDLDDDEGLWQSLEDADLDEVECVLDQSSKQRLSCFAHTLQLVIGDGLKEMKGLTRATAKASRISTLLHRSTIFKERYLTN